MVRKISDALLSYNEGSGGYWSCHQKVTSIIGSVICGSGAVMSASREIDPLELFQQLSAAGVPFIIIGGHAVSFHGFIRATEDSDIVFQRTSMSELNLLKALQELDARWISPDRDSTTNLERLIPISLSYIQSQHLMMLSTKSGFLDIYDYIPGFPDLPVEQLWNDGVECDGLRFVSLQWLRRLKQKAARPKDHEDLENLPLA